MESELNALFTIYRKGETRVEKDYKEALDWEEPKMNDEKIRKKYEFDFGGGNEKLEKEAYSRWEMSTELFAKSIQIGRVWTEDIDFSKPFRMVIDYDPEQPRAIRHLYMSKSSGEQCTRQEYLQFLEDLLERLRKQSRCED